MKQVMITYGGTVVALIIMGAVLTFMSSLIFGGSFSESTEGNGTSSSGILSTLLEESIGNQGDATDGREAFLSYREREIPEILFVETCEIRTGEYVPVENCFFARDQEGKEVPVEVTDIISLQEKNLPTIEYENKICFYFEVPGVYQIYVKATDQQDRTEYAMVKVPVNKGDD